MKKFFYLYDACIEKTAALFLGISVVILFAQVITRYFLHSPIMWTDEIGRYLFIWIVYLGSASAFIRRKHLQVDIITQYMPEKIKYNLNLVFQIVIILFLFLVFIFGLQYAMKNMGNPAYSTNAISLGVAYISVPVGALLMVINIVRVILEDFRTKKEGE